MKGIVRKAQSNFQFAMIFEQRKTNQILVAGFTNLALALEQMTWRITRTIGDLASSVEAMGRSINESLLDIDSQVRESAEETTNYRKGLSREASEHIGREERVVEMLDNIQRRRIPPP
jgi:DNA anti-recombination protein RmuC